MPRRELVRSTRWYDEYKQPLLGCTLTIRQVKAVRPVRDRPRIQIGGPTLLDKARDGVLEFDDVSIAIEVDAIDATLVVSDDVVGHRRLRIGHGIRWESWERW
jgi:hypothetical protein